MGKVHEVIIENFKSYEGRVRVGPFRKFTCIVGPNGAGKSNLMDAISFVLGVHRAHLRSDRHQDLVHRKATDRPGQPPRIAAVELVFSNDEGDQHIVFRRVIQVGREARFLVDGMPVTQADYVGRLEAINILSRARNFLVFQGDLEAAAQREGKDLTMFFEQVSGSAALREEYERLRRAKEEKEETARHVYTRKRNAMNEQRAVGQQKQEADRYRQLEVERRRLQTEFWLFRLYRKEVQAEQATQRQEAMQAAMDEHAAKLEAAQSELQATEQQRAQAHLATAQAERLAAEAVARQEALSPECASSRGRLQVLEQRLQDFAKHTEREARKRQLLERETRRLEQEQAKLEEELQSRTEEVERELVFTVDQRAEFERARGEAKKLTAASADQVRDLEAQVKSTTAERGRAERELRELTAKSEHLSSRIDELTEKEAKSRQFHEEEAKHAQEHSERLAGFGRVGADRADEKQRLLAERRGILEEIQDITATERQIEQESRMRQVSQSLKQLVIGVHGRIVELCSPSQRRLAVAVNVALGGFLDAIVVDTMDAAQQCLRYLKERQLASFTFLPLDTLRVQGVDQRLHAAVGEQHAVRHALSCLSFDDQYAHAFEFALGDTVIADTLQDGRRFAFDELRAKGLGCRVVTLEGEAISRDGNISVSSEVTREGATRFDVGEMEQQKTKLDTIDRRLHQLHAQESVSISEREALVEQVRRFEARAAECLQNAERSREELEVRRRELGEAEAGISTTEPKLARLIDEEAKLREDQQALEESIGQAVRGLFENLSAEMGVEDIRKEERDWRRAREAAKARSSDLAQQLGSVKAERKIMEDSLRDLAPQDPEEARAAYEAEVAALQVQCSELDDQEKACQVEVEQASALIEERAEAERLAEQEVTASRQSLREVQNERAEAERAMSSATAEVQTVLDEREHLIRQCVVEDVDVPMVGGETAASIIARGPSAAASAAINFSILPEPRRAVALVGDPGAAALENEYRGELRRLETEAEALRPNLKALAKMEIAREEAQGAAQEALVARRDTEDAEARFEAVRRRRREIFMTTFEQVSLLINTVYNKLTAGAHPGLEGGAAYLDVEDLDEPFNGAVKFTAMPPAKRFTDVQHLSGGEKSLAVMALIFAVQLHQRPPFLVLDEVDASLDNSNLQALARFVQEAECQTIVISLKDKLFARSEGLVGVTKDRRRDSSVAMTLDLVQFRQAEQIVPSPGSGGHAAAPTSPVPLCA